MKNILNLMMVVLFFMTALLLIYVLYKYFNERILAARSLFAVIFYAVLMIILLFGTVSLALYGLIAATYYLSAE